MRRPRRLERYKRAQRGALERSWRKPEARRVTGRQGAPRGSCRRPRSGRVVCRKGVHPRAGGSSTGKNPGRLLSSPTVPPDSESFAGLTRTAAGNRRNTVSEYPIRLHTGLPGILQVPIRVTDKKDGRVAAGPDPPQEFCLVAAPAGRFARRTEKVGGHIRAGPRRCRGCPAERSRRCRDRNRRRAWGGFRARRKGFPALRRRSAARSGTHVRYRHGECVAKTANAHLFGSRHSLAWSASFDLTANEPFVSVPLGATAAARTGAAPCGLCPPFG